MNLCLDLRDNSELVVDKEVKCWMFDFDTYVRTTSSGTKSVPIADPAEFETLLKAFAYETKAGQEY